MGNFYVETLGDLKQFDVRRYVIFEEGQSEVGLVESYLDRLGADDKAIKVVSLQRLG